MKALVSGKETKTQVSGNWPQVGQTFHQGQGFGSRVQGHAWAIASITQCHPSFTSWLQLALLSLPAVGPSATFLDLSNQAQ